MTEVNSTLPKWIRASVACHDINLILITTSHSYIYTPGFKGLTINSNDITHLNVYIYGGIRRTSVTKFRQVWLCNHQILKHLQIMCVDENDSGQCKFGEKCPRRPYYWTRLSELTIIAVVIEIWHLSTCSCVHVTVYNSTQPLAPLGVHTSVQFSYINI